MMKRQTVKRGGLAALCFGLIACSQNPSKPDPEGNIARPEWPAPENATFDNRQGTFPSPDSVDLIRTGMTKDQVYELLGRPHFTEGIFKVREWDYLFYFPTGKAGTEEVTTCQFKIIFDKDFISRTLYWKAVSPVGSVCPPSSQRKQTAAADTGFELSSDLLFGFDSAVLRDDDVESAKVLDELITHISSPSAPHTLLIQGYSDRLGSSAYNWSLSEARANAVRNYLVEHGVPSERLFAEGRGEYVPGTPCRHETGAALKTCLSPDRKVVITGATP
ncbi:OmpA family protein [Salmonella enterica]|uniref:OmpA family protein n=1 Tax=Salmonella enterica TaxID=28901 RepID=UPI00300EE446|nr:outer membrane protein assembly factor BamE [Salmonella enterica]